MNRWNIPPELEARVCARDQSCIYCRRPFVGLEGPRGQRRSWEHIVNDASIVTEWNIALCCISCNASKGAKDLPAWLASKYCLLRGINTESIAPVAKLALASEARRQHPPASEETHA